MAGTTLRVALADDDLPTCSLLKDIVGTFEGVVVVGIANDGNSLLRLVARTKPDIVFADIQMPDLDGLAAVSRLRKACPEVFIVFVTAYPQYAAEAFNLDAADYVVKPLDRDRIERALAKARRFMELRTIGGANVYKTPGQEAVQQQSGHKKLFIKSGRGAVLLDTRNVLFIEKAGKKCVIHTCDNRYETQESLAEMEKDLDKTKFFRCHKSFIINVDHVEKVLPYADRAYEVIFYDYPRKVTMRRDAFEAFCRLVK